MQFCRLARGERPNGCTLRTLVDMKSVLIGFHVDIHVAAPPRENAYACNLAGQVARPFHAASCPYATESMTSL